MNTRGHGRFPNSVSFVIIDDNPRSLEFISTAFSRDGISIFTATNPEEGLDLVYTHRPQVVMTDLVMPGMTGLRPCNDCATRSFPVPVSPVMSKER